MERKSLKQMIFMIILGAMIGTLIGELITLLLPTGVVKEFFLRSAAISLGPGTLDLRLLSITFGFTIKFNIVGFIGIGIAFYFLRWY